MRLLLSYQLNEKQRDKISDIASDIGLVGLASVVIPAFFDKFNPAMVLLGLLTTLGFWIFSVWLRK